MSSISLSLLGDFRISVGGQAIKYLPPKKAQALLIYLAVETGRKHRRESLFTLLWPGMPEKSARHNLRQLLYQLGQLFPDLHNGDTEEPIPLLLSDRNTTCLNPDVCVTTDIFQLDLLLEGTQNHHHIHINCCTECQNALAQALNLYRGDFLSGFYIDDSNEFENWIIANREDYRRKILTVLDRLVEGNLIAGKPEQALNTVNRQLAIDPLRESAYRGLMSAQLLLGLRSDALRTYQRCVEILKTELDIEPSPNTQGLYEMISSNLPTEGDELESIIFAYLNKKADLSRASVPGPYEKSIVVLPFHDLSPSKDDEHFSDGLTEELITDLSQLNRLRVISRTSSMAYKRKDVNLKTISSELNVQYVLEGSIRKSGNNLRITAQLIDSVTDTNIWADRYSGNLNDIFDIQEKVSRSIVKALKVKLTPEESDKLADHPIDNIVAYEVYLRARQALWAFDHIAIQRAERDLLNAVEHVGEIEYFYATLGRVNIRYIELGVQSDENFLQKTEAYADKIFAINPNSPYGYILMGFIHHFQGDLQSSVKAFKNTLINNPNDTDALMMLGYNYALSGKTSVSIPLAEKLLAIDPLTPIHQSLLGFSACLEGRFSDGLIPYRKMYTLNPESPAIRLFFGWCLYWNQQYEEAVSLFDANARDMPGIVLTQLSLFFKYAMLAQKEKAFECITPDVIATARWVEYQSRILAEGYALLEEIEESITWLENAISFGFINYPYLIKHAPAFAKIRDDERFQELIKRVKHRWKHFDV